MGIMIEEKRCKVCKGVLPILITKRRLYCDEACRKNRFFLKKVEGLANEMLRRKLIEMKLYKPEEDVVLVKDPRYID